MIAVDSSTLIAHLAGDTGKDVARLEAALRRTEALLPPAVVTEMLSARDTPRSLEEVLSAMPMLVVTDGYWERAGALRRLLLQRRLKAAMADALIAQSCIDHAVPLLTRDADFAAFAKFGRLQLV